MQKTLCDRHPGLGPAGRAPYARPTGAPAGVRFKSQLAILLTWIVVGCGDSANGGTVAGLGGASAGGSGSGSAAADGGNSAAAGASSSGGVVSAGGGTSPSVGASGGAPSGGASDTGAVAGGGTGGTLGTGAGSPTGGTSATGGAGVTGGATSAGGSASTGGSPGSGGSVATGGAFTGGTEAAGGTTATESDLWIATDGSDSNPGTEAEPLLTLVEAHSRASAGMTLWIEPGTYSWSTTVTLTTSGTDSSPINVFAAPGDRPVIDFSGQPRDTSSARGIQVKGDYWHIKGIDVMNAGDNCIHISGSHNTIEWVKTHGCCDTGLQITVDSSQASDATRGAYNTVINCDSYENYDTATGGENADGFAAKLFIGPGNVFRGCRAWNNCDDGWDLFASDDVVVIDDSWAFLNGQLASGGGTANGDGNGFKLGGAASAAYQGGAPHEVTGCFAFENNGCGFTLNNNTSTPVLSQCGGRDDGNGEFCSLTNSSPVSFSMTGAEAKAVVRDADGSLPPIQ